MERKLVRNLQQQIDEVFERACIKYYSDCYKCPFGVVKEPFNEGEYDCIVQQFDECLQQIAEEQESSDFKTTNEEYFNKKNDEFEKE